MMVFSVGLPGRFAVWCDAAIARAVEFGLGPALLVGAETADEVATGLIGAATPHLVVASRGMIPSLRVLLAGSHAPMIVAFDDPRQALRDLMTEPGQDIRTATRIVAGSCAAALVCAGLPGAVVVRAGPPGGDPVDRVGAIAQSCGLSLSGAEIAAVLAAVPEAEDAGPIEPWWGALDPDERALADGALAAYAGHFRSGAGIGEITWDRTLFWCAADPARHAGGAIEIGAEPAPLVAGPGIGLPPGDWAATVTLAVSKEAAGIGFGIEVWAADHPVPLAAAAVVPDARGLGSATLRFAVAAPAGQTIGLGIANTAPAAAGARLALGNLTLAPARGDGSDIPSELTTVLGL